MVGSPCSQRDSQQSSPAPQFKSINSSALSLHYGPTLTSIRDSWKDHSLDCMDFASKVMSPLYCQSFIRSNIGCWTGGPVSRDGRKDEELRAGLGKGACPAGVLGTGGSVPGSQPQPCPLLFFPSRARPPPPALCRLLSGVLLLRWEVLAGGGPSGPG